MTAENELLRCLARVKTEPAAAREARRIVLSGPDWGLLLRTAREQDVTSLLYRSLLKLDGARESVPEKIMTELEECYRAVGACNISFLDDLRQVLEAFEKRGLEVMALKGAHLAETVYGNVALRPMRDIDLLVRSEDLRRVHAALTRLGYACSHDWIAHEDVRPGHHLNSVRYTGGGREPATVLHIHWHILNSTVPTYAYQNKVDIKRFWDGAQREKIAGAAALVMAPHHLLIHLSEHILKHSYGRLILSCDIAEAVRHYDGNGLDWDTLVREATILNLTKPVYYALRFTSAIRPIRIPDDVLGCLRPSRLNHAEKEIQRLVEQGRSLTDLSYFSYLVMNENIIDMLRFAFRSVFPPREALALHYAIPPGKVRPHHYAARLWKMSVRLAAAVPQLLGNGKRGR